MATLLDVVKNDDALYAMLRQEPSSKLLRYFLKKHLNLQNIPVLVTFEEWQEWLASQTTTPLKTQEEAQSAFFQKCLSLLPFDEINVSQLRTFYVCGKLSSVEHTTTDLRALYRRNTRRFNEILEPIYNCQTDAELENLDADDIISNLMNLAHCQIDDLLDDEEFPEYLGDLHVREVHVEEKDAIEADGLYSLVDDFVYAIADYRH